MNRSTSLVVPPGGFAGFSQMTPASRAALSRSVSRPRSRKRRASTGGKRSSRTRSSRKRGGTRKLRFGSLAWQRKYRVGKFAKKR